MADKTTIEWSDATWQIITGCTVISAGCRACYAQQLAGTRLKHHPSRAGLTKMVNGHPVWTGEVRFNEQWLDQPLRWKRGRRIFAVAHGDLFHENVPDEWLDRVFAVMALAPHHTFQVLTKRAARMRAYCSGVGIANRIWHVAEELACRLNLLEHHPSEAYRNVGARAAPWPLPNVQLGVSVEDEENAKLRIPELLETEAAVLWVSYEPALGPVDFSPYLSDHPLHVTAEERERGNTLPSRVGDLDRGSAGRLDLADRSATKERLGREGDREAGQAASDRCSDQGQLPNGQDHGRRQADELRRSSTGLADATRSNPDRFDHQPQGREEGSKRTRQLGTGDVFGSADSRRQDSEGGALRESGRGEKSRGEVVDGAGFSDTPSSEQRRKGDAAGSGIRRALPAYLQDRQRRATLGWIVQGGESGRAARPFNLAWGRQTIADCKKAGVPCFTKQLGKMPYEGDGDPFKDSNCKLFPLDLDPVHGADWLEWPEDLRVREFP